jgi:hypothetical protein
MNLHRDAEKSVDHARSIDSKFKNDMEFPAVYQGTCLPAPMVEAHLLANAVDKNMLRCGGLVLAPMLTNKIVTGKVSSLG